MNIFAKMCGESRVSENVPYPPDAYKLAAAATPPLRAHHLEEHMRQLGDQPSSKVTPRKKQSHKPSVSFASPNGFDQDLDLEDWQLAERDHWEKGSDETASEADNTKKQLEELQMHL
jgi:hypothetical protein